MHSAYLHKILRDETRRKIVLLLHEQSSLTYSDLLEALKTQNKGSLNYHLKALSPLLEKADSNYSLNEQGVLAWKMLQEFAYTQKSRLATIVKYGRNIVAVGLVAVFFISYHQYLSTVWLIGVSAVLSIVTLALVVLVKVQYGRLSSCQSTDCIDVSLHETLTDPTRRKILSLLRENGPLNYTELMNRAGVSSSGQMNYHLKALSDVLSVDEKGQYSLTEKGVFAYTSQYSLRNRRGLLKINPLWQQWIAIAFVSVLMLFASFLFYSRGTFDIETTVLSVVNVAIVSSSLLYVSKVNDNLKLYKVKDTRMV
ncbi:MAG: helix-turn-helix domain-containing protein [Candidatus Bathyarchaeia archaeon]